MAGEGGGRRERLNLGEITVFGLLATGEAGEGPFLFLFERANSGKG